eukprot:scaffold459836_cov28-Prasinocladus_malaysianus.AAC.1
MQQLELIFKLLGVQQHATPRPMLYNEPTGTMIVCVKPRKSAIALAKPAAGTGGVSNRGSPSPRIWPGLRDMPLWSKVVYQHSPIK